MTNNRRQKVKHRQFINSILLDNNVGKIELWGDVMESKPLDWWTGEPLDIQCITPQDFKDAMAELQNCSTIELHLNSYGGDATVGIAIGNLLKQSGKHTICVVDGIAASAAFTIAMSCDEVHVYPSSILMCHEVKSLLWGYYGNDDLKKIENGNTAYNNASAEVYSRKSGMSKAQCLNLMKKETWFTGTDAISYKFADKLLSIDEGQEPPVELINKTTMKINGVEHDISGLNIPEEFIQKTNLTTGGNGMSKEGLKDKVINAISAIFKNEVEEEEEKTEVKEEEEKQNAEGDDEEEEKEKENKAKNAEGEDEEEKEPEEAEGEEKEKEEEKENAINQEFVNSAVEAERKRIQEIEEIANGIDADLVQEAKFGNNACDAKELALRALQRETEKTNKALEDLKSDTEKSKVNEVETVQAAEIVDSENLTESQAQNAVKAMYKKLNQAKEEK